MGEAEGECVIAFSKMMSPEPVHCHYIGSGLSTVALQGLMGIQIISDLIDALLMEH